MSTANAVPLGGHVDRDRINQIFTDVHARMTGVDSALDTDDRREAWVLLREATQLLEIATDVIKRARVRRVLL